MYTEKIKELAEEYFNRVVELRHTFHMNPELGHQEEKTSKIIYDELIKYGIEARRNIAKTGVVGLIRGKYPGKTILLRADMDALPIQEKVEVSYKSQVPGKMHACGHDGHSASLLGTAMILNRIKDELHGCVKLVFQPDEEYEGGAKPMIDEGVLENPTVDAALGLHLWGQVPEGMVHVIHGPAMAAPDIFKFKIIGKGGHGGMPHLCVDPIVITAQTISEMQLIISRTKNPFNPAVISFGAITGGKEYNIIPESVQVIGTMRTFDENLRVQIPRIMEEILKGQTEPWGASYEFVVEKSIPAVVNDSRITDIVERAAAKIIGIKNVKEAPEPFMGGEDFAYFSQKVPSSFFFVGISPDMKNPVIHHSPDFEWSDRNLYTSMTVMSQAAIDFLNE